MTVASLCAVIVGAVYWRLSQGPISLDFMRDTVRSEINRNLTGLEVRLAGVQIERDPETRVPQFRLRNLELVDRAGNTIARAPRAAIGVDESALVTGSVVPRHLDLIGPRIMVKRAVNGGFVMGFGQPASAEAGEVESNHSGKSDHGAPAAEIAPETSGASVIEALSAPASPEGSASAGISTIDFIRVSKAELTLFDEANNAYWNAPEAELVFRRMPYGFAVVAEASIQSEGEPIRTEIAASYRRQQRDFSISARIFNFVPSSASRKIFALSQLARVNLPLAGQAELEMTEEGQITKGTAEFTVGAGQLAFPDFIADPIVVDEGSLRLDYDPATGGVVISDSNIVVGPARAAITGRIDPERSEDRILRALNIVIEARNTLMANGDPAADPHPVDRIDFRGIASVEAPRLDMDDLLVMSGDSGVRLRGIFIGGERSPGISLAGRIRNMPAPLLKKLWPPIIAPNTRRWVNQNIRGGRITDGEITVQLARDELADSRVTKVLPEGSIKLKFALSDVTTSYFRNLPVISAASGTASLEDNRFAIRLERGEIETQPGRRIALTGGTMTVTDLLKPVSPAEFHILAEAEVPAVFEYMNAPDLNLLKTAGFDVGRLSGSASIDLTLAMPFMKDMPRERVKVSATAKVADASLKQAAEGIDISDGNIAVNVEPGIIRGEGPVKLNGIGARLTWIRQTGGQEAHQATIETELDDKERDKIGAKLGSFLTGPVKVKATIAEVGNPASPLDVEADLSKATVTIGVIDWLRGPAKGTKARFRYSKGDSGTAIEDLQISGNDLVLKGEVMLDKGGGFVEARLPAVKLDDDNEFALTMKRTGDGMAVTIDGRSFDARPLIKSMFSGGASTAASTAEDPLTYLVTARFDRVIAHRGEILIGLNGTIVSRANAVLSANLQGSFLSGQPVSMRIEPSAAGREFRIAGRDGGAALRAANLYSKIAGGQLEFYAHMGHGGQSGVRNGQLIIRNFEVRNEAALAELDARGKPKSSGPRRDSIAFKRLKLPFTADARFLRIGEAEVTGNEICATVDKGLIRKADGAIDIDGTIIPACGLNNIPGKIPLVELFVGEGLFALTYALYGTINDPKFQYNPISAVAPGILRKFFEFGDVTPPKNPGRPGKSN